MNMVIVVEVEGGCVSRVLVTDSEVTVHIVDRDNHVDDAEREEADRVLLEELRPSLVEILPK